MNNESFIAARGHHRLTMPQVGADRMQRQVGEEEEVLEQTRAEHKLTVGHESLLVNGTWGKSR